MTIGMFEFLCALNSLPGEKSACCASARKRSGGFEQAMRSHVIDGYEALKQPALGSGMCMSDRLHEALAARVAACCVIGIVGMVCDGERACVEQPASAAEASRPASAATAYATSLGASNVHHFHLTKILAKVESV